MARYERFTFLCSESEKEAISKLAAQLSRSQSDAVRYVVLQAARQLTQAADDPKQSQTRSDEEDHAVTA
jgi:hypothetical protein